MPRPQRYARRVDTKIRLRLDHREALDQVVDETPGLSRNALVEQILDAHFKMKAPRLTKTPVSPEIQRSEQDAQARTSPRLRKVGQEMADATEDIPAPRVSEPKTRVKPRQRRI